MCGSSFKFSLLLDNIAGSLYDEMKSKSFFSEDELWSLID